jgi:hypothetical protein
MLQHWITKPGIEEGSMGEWKAVYEGEVEGRPVTVKVYESEDAEDEDGDIAVRVLTTSIHDYAGALEQNEGGQTLIASPEEVGAPITLEPAIVDDLEEELREVGFSHEAAARIVSKVPR